MNLTPQEFAALIVQLAAGTVLVVLGLVGIYEASGLTQVILVLAGFCGLSLWAEGMFFAGRGR